MQSDAIQMCCSFGALNKDRNKSSHREQGQDLDDILLSLGYVVASFAEYCIHCSDNIKKCELVTIKSAD
jgi:hypothetical protein